VLLVSAAHHPTVKILPDLSILFIYFCFALSWLLCVLLLQKTVDSPCSGVLSIRLLLVALHILWSTEPS